MRFEGLGVLAQPSPNRPSAVRPTGELRGAPWARLPLLTFAVNASGAEKKFADVALPDPRPRRSTQIIRLLVSTVIGKPRLTISIALLLLATLAATLTYCGVLVIGVLTDYLGTSRFVTGLLLGALFAEFPWISNGKPRLAGLLLKPVRLPLMAGLLALCLLLFFTQQDVVPATRIGVTLAFLLGFPWLKRRLLVLVSSSVFNFAAGRKGRWWPIPR